MHFINLFTRKVFKNCSQFRLFVGSFNNARELQILLSDKIASFKGFKNPKSFIAVIRKFEKETNEKCIY